MRSFDPREVIDLADCTVTDVDAPAPSVKPGHGRVACRWCGQHVADRPGKSYCVHCGHRSDVPPEACDCNWCRPPSGRPHLWSHGEPEPFDRSDPSTWQGETFDLSQDFSPDGKPVPALEPTMSEPTVRKLASAEYDFARLDAGLSDLRDLLRQAAREAPRCAVAARQLHAIRKMLRRILDALDADVSAAVAQLELLGPAPF
jgi:hypothetical protein